MGWPVAGSTVAPVTGSIVGVAGGVAVVAPGVVGAPATGGTARAGAGTLNRVLGSLMFFAARWGSTAGRAFR